MKLETEDAVAQIHQGCRRIAFDGFAGPFGTLQRDDLLTSFKGRVALSCEIVVFRSAVLHAVKDAVAGIDHVLNFFGHRHAVLLHLLHGGLQTNGVPGFKRPQFEIEAPLHGIVDIDDGV